MKQVQKWLGKMHNSTKGYEKCKTGPVRSMYLFITKLQTVDKIILGDSFDSVFGDVTDYEM
jgi:hypothetical protein